MVASALDVPLEYRERIVSAMYLSIINVPFMSRQESDALICAVFQHLENSPRPEIFGIIYDRFEGALEATIKVCCLAATQFVSTKQGGTDN